MRWFTKKKGNYSGISPNGQNNSLQKSFFPRPSPFTRKNGRVPKLRLNVRNNGVLSYGDFVSPQNPNNNIKNIRNKTYEQNFLQRLATNIQNAVINEKPINLKLYSDRLQAPDITREEAIMLYNELIALCIIFLLYLLEFYTNTVGLSKLKYPEKMQKAVNNRKITIKIMSVVVTGMILGIATTIPISLLLVIPTILSVGVIIIKDPANVFGIKNKSITFRANSEQFITSITNIMFSRNNTIKINDVRNYLKYWGLRTNQVDALFNFNQNENTTEFVNTEDVCRICLEPYSGDDNTKIIKPCNHKFHKSCIDSWLKDHTTCPYCNKEVYTNNLKTMLSKYDPSSQQRGPFAPNEPLHIITDPTSQGQINLAERNLGETSNNLPQIEPQIELENQPENQQPHPFAVQGGKRRMRKKHCKTTKKNRAY